VYEIGLYMPYKKLEQECSNSEDLAYVF